MRFTARATSEEDYHNWLEKVRTAESTLYSEKNVLFAQESRDEPITYFRDVNPLLFKDIIESLTVVQNGPN